MVQCNVTVFSMVMRIQSCEIYDLNVVNSLALVSDNGVMLLGRGCKWDDNDIILVFMK